MSEFFFVLEVAKLLLLQDVMLPLLLVLSDGGSTILLPELIRPGLLG
jgi:hypothetical protein